MSPVNNEQEYDLHGHQILSQRDKHGHLKLKLAVCGAAETGHCGVDILEKAKELGRQIIKQEGMLLTGATTGFPFWAAMGAKEVHGISVGLSPAATEKEHVEVYKLPLDYMDLIIYTGFGFAGRDIFLTRASDAVFIGCGRIGTIHEFTVAFEDQKPIGILEGEWYTDEIIKKIVETAHRGPGKLVFDPDPETLVRKIVELVRREKVQEYKVIK